MSRADDLAREREALRERAAEQRLAIVATAATLRERLTALRTLVSAAGVLAGTARTLWRRWRRGRTPDTQAPAAPAQAPAPAAGPDAQAPERPAPLSP